MKWIPINKQLPELDRPLLVTVQYGQREYKEVTDSEYTIAGNSDGKPTFSMGSACDFKIFAWMYQPDEYAGNDGIEYKKTWNENRCAHDVKRTNFYEINI